MQKEHFEVILEDINSKIDLVVEGHAGLNKKINDLDKKIDGVRDDLGREIQSFRNEVSESNRQNKEDHLALFQMINTVSQENKDLRKEFVKFRKENETAHKSMRKENETAHNGFRQELDEFHQKFDEFREENETAHKGFRQELDEFREENETAHKEILGGIKLSYRELDSRMKFLEQEVSSLSQRVSCLEAARV